MSLARVLLPKVLLSGYSCCL